jgi:hypothetical protein
MATQTTLPQPTKRGSNWSDTDSYYMLMVQSQHPLVTVDTSAGDQVIALPPPGAQQSTGQTNQNKEITYLKSSADANMVTITGAQGGNVVLTAQSPAAGSTAKFKSDGAKWWKTA